MGIETHNNSNTGIEQSDLNLGKNISFPTFYNRRKTEKQQEEQQRKQQESQQESREQNNEKVNSSIQKFFTDSLKELGAEKFIEKFNDDNIQLLDILKSLPQDNPFFKDVADFFSKHKNYTPYINAFKPERVKALETAKLQLQQIKQKQREKQEINKIQKDIPTFINEIQQGTIKIQFHDDSIPFTWSHFLYAIKNNQAIDLDIEDQDKKTQLKDIIAFISTHKLKTSYNLFKNYIPKDTEAVNYLNELPKNRKDWERALSDGADELSQIFQIRKNQETLAELTGLSQDELNDTRNLRAFLLTHQDIFDTIVKTFNYDEETKNISKDKKSKEQVLDTSNYTFRIMERYGIDKGKREQKKFDDGGTGLFALTNYYLNNKNKPQAQAFCKEYEETILPELMDKFNQTKFKSEKITTFEDLVNLIRNNAIDLQDDQALCSQLFGTVGNSLNENNKTEGLEKNRLTPESIKRGEKLVNVFENTSNEPTTPEGKKTMEQVLQGEYFQKQLEHKMQQLMENPKLSNFFAKYPSLKPRFTLENIAKYDGRDPAQKLLIQLVGNTFVSKKALDSYQHNLIDTNKLDDINAITETVDLVFEEALNDESLFKEFEQGPDFAFDEAENLKLQEIDLTDTYLPKMLGDFDKLHDGSLSQPIEALAKENAKDDTGHEPLKELFKLKVGQNLNEFFTKLHQGLVDKFAKTNKYISLPKDIFTNIFDISEWDEKKEPSFRRGEFKLFLTMNGIPTTHFDTYKQKIEDSVRKRVKAECEKKTEFKENIGTSLYKIMISDRVSYTISKLKDSPFTKGLKLDTSKAENVQIDGNLNVKINGTYDGKPCQLCINQDGTVKITAYYHNQGDNITFDNSPNFLLFQIPSIKEQEEIGYGTLNALGNRRKEDRKEVYSQLQEHHTIKEEGIEDFPLQKEKGLCFLKIKELLGFTETSFNPENAEYQPVCEFFNDFADCIKSPHIAREINAFLGELANLQQQVRDGNDWIKENSKSTFDLFDRMPKNQANGLKDFQENPYILVLQHFMKPDGNGYKFNIDDALMYISAFKQGDQVLQARDAKIRGEDGSEQYRIYADTPLTQYLKNLEEKTH